MIEIEGRTGESVRTLLPRGGLPYRVGASACPCESASFSQAPDPTALPPFCDSWIAGRHDIPRIMKQHPSPARSLAALAGIALLTFSASLTGMIVPPGAWYASLAKPEWNPPSWVFGPVWTMLYLMMAVAAWLVWKRDGWRWPLRLYLVQLALNAAWTPIFFGAREIGWALVAIIALWFAILSTLLAFLRVSKPAGSMFVPYLAWVSFATFLNYTLWRMNPG